MLKRVQHDSRVFAFTLAEVLITLVIIGIIAALTIPNLLQKYQEQATVKKVQKFYSTLSNAYNLAIKENGPMEEWGLIDYDVESAKKIYNLLFKPYFKIAKNCGSNTEDCNITTTKYKALNNELRGTYIANAYYKILLNDGATVWWASHNTGFGILYDVNGKKGPNQWGVDLFQFYKSKSTILPFGINMYPFNLYCQKSRTDASQGVGCLAWVIYKGNMDYLHCDGLTWNSRSCKEK